MLIHLICAARPNFMKIAPLYHVLKKTKWARPVIVHTGQHYDANMSDAFFKDLGLPKPDIYLGVGSGTHAEQTGKVMVLYEEVLTIERPDLVVVVGDVNSTMAATIAASKVVYPGPSHIQEPIIRSMSGRPIQDARSRKSLRRPLVAHLEAGLRSFDRTMPEELNRLVTDSLADILWTPSADADRNLRREGITPEKIRRVGNIMIDSLELMREQIEKQNTWRDLGLQPRRYGIVTMHRPSNVDDPATLRKFCRILKRIAKQTPLVFPVHPRTLKNMAVNGFLDEMKSSGNLHMPEPLPYVRFMNLVFNCRFVITDSGGIQEETSHLGIPCLTARENTERPVTVTHGTNQLCGLDDLREKTDEILQGRVRRPKKINLWDGRTADRIVAHLQEFRTK